MGKTEVDILRRARRMHKPRRTPGQHSKLNDARLYAESAGLCKSVHHGAKSNGDAGAEKVAGAASRGNPSRNGEGAGSAGRDGREHAGEA